MRLTMVEAISGGGLLLDFPVPRRIASRPVACIASNMAEGAAVPSIDTSCSLRSAVTLFMPAQSVSHWRKAMRSFHTIELV